MSSSRTDGRRLQDRAHRLLLGGGSGIEFAATGAPLVANVAIHGSVRDRAPGWAANAKGMFLICTAPRMWAFRSRRSTA